MTEKFRLDTQDEVKGKVLIYGATLQSAQQFYEYLKENGLTQDYTYITTCSESKGCGFTCEQIYIDRQALSCEVLTALLPCLWQSEVPSKEQVYYYQKTENWYTINPRVIGSFQPKIFV